MNFIKRSVRQLLNIGRAYSRYPLTMLLFLTLAVINAFQIVDEFGGYERLLHGFLVSILLTLVATHINERFINDGKKRWSLLASAVILSILYYFILPINDASYLIYEVRTAVLVFALFIAFIWIPSIKNKRNYFYEYFLTAFKFGFTTLLYGLILSIGVQAIISSIDYLLFSVDYDYFIHAANIIWFIFVPSYFLSLVPLIEPYHSNNEMDKEDRGELLTEKIEVFEVTKFLKILINYIIIPLILVYTFILVAYILLNIRGEFWTDNLLEPMLISYTIIVILVYLLAANIEEPIAHYFRMIFPKVLIPIVLFQSIASLLKIQDMGITHGRYYVILFGIFSLIAGIIFSFLGKEKAGWIVPFLVVLAVLSVIPPIDAFTVAKSSQKSLLTNTLTENEMLRENKIQSNSTIGRKDKEKITSSTDYLYYLDYSDEIAFLPEDFEIYDDFENVFGFPMTYEDTQIDDELGQYAFLEWPGNNAISIGEEDYFVQIYLSNYDEEVITETIDINEEYILYTENDPPYFKLSIENQTTNKVLTIDLEPLFIKAFDAISTREQITNEDEMTLIVENNEVHVKIVALELMKNSSNSIDSTSAELLIFIDIKNQ